MTSQWARWYLKSPASRLFAQPYIHARIKGNIKAPRHWPLCGEFTGDRWIPHTNATYSDDDMTWNRFLHHWTFVRGPITDGFRQSARNECHYNDFIKGLMAYQITSLAIVYSTVYSGADQRKYQSSASLAFVRGNDRWIPRQMASNAEMFPFDDVIMFWCFLCYL